MKNHIAFKFLAILLCACMLLVSLASAAAIVFLMCEDLYEQSPHELLSDNLERHRHSAAQTIAARYAAKTLGGCPEILLESYYNIQGYFSAYTTAFYTIQDADGSILETTYDGSAADVYSFTVSPVYPILLDHTMHSTAVNDPYAATDSQAQAEAIAPTIAHTATLSEESFSWYEEETSTVHICRIGYLPGPEYRVTLYLSGQQEVFESDVLVKLVILLWQYRYQLFMVLATSLLLFAVFAVYLCCAAGRKPGSDEIRPAGLNLLPIDLYAAIVCAAVFSLIYFAGHLLGYGYSAGILPVTILIAALLALLGCLLIVGLLFAVVSQCKAGIGFLWRHSIVGFLCIGAWKLLAMILHQLDMGFHWLGSRLPPFAARTAKGLVKFCRSGYAVAKTATVLGVGWCAGFLRRCGKVILGICSRVWSGASRFISLLPLTWQWLLTAFVMGMLLLIGFLSRSTVQLFFCMGCCAAIVLYGAHAFGILLERTRRMCSGDLDSKVSDRMLVGSFKDFADHLNALAGVVVIAAQKQMRSERMKAELVTNVSHDIKTPLTSIINYVDLLQKASTPEESKEYLEVLSRQSQRMKKLIDDLMEMSKATTGNLPVEITRVNAAEAVNQALGEFSDKLAAAQLRPVCNLPAEPVYMKADGRLAWRVLSNLLSNAVKYALPGTRLYIDLVTVEDQVLISLKNISREPLNVDSEELMERFVRGDASRNTEGSGLGLNIARSLMELQHGQLQLLIDGDLFKATLIFPATE